MFFHHTSDISLCFLLNCMYFENYSTPQRWANPVDLALCYRNAWRLAFIKALMVKRMTVMRAALFSFASLYFEN